MTQKDDTNDDRSSLDAAKKELSEMRGRPFDVDKILAQNRARQERERKAQKEAQQKLEREIEKARQRRHALQAHEVELASQALEEKRQKFEIDKRLYDKKEQERKRGGGDKRLEPSRDENNRKQH